MRKLIRVLWLRFKLSIAESMHDRTDFAIGVIGETLIVGVHLVGVLIIFQNAPIVSGWSVNQALLVLGFYQVVDGVAEFCFHGNIKHIPKLVRYGQLDAALTKPFDVQMNLLRRFDLTAIGPMASGVAILGLSLHRLGVPLTAGTTVIVLGGLVLGVAFSWALHFLLNTLGFWLVRNENLVHLAWVTQSLSRLPTPAYGTAIEFTTRFLVPLAIIGTVPAELLTDQGSVWLALWSVVVTIGMVLLARWFFHVALRGYSSASS